MGDERIFSDLDAEKIQNNLGIGQSQKGKENVRNRKLTVIFVKEILISDIEVLHVHTGLLALPYLSNICSLYQVWGTFNEIKNFMQVH